MDIIGKTTIHPLLFFSGKTAGYITWIIMALVFFNVIELTSYANIITGLASFLILLISLFYIVLSLVNLGKSTRLGLPAEDTEFKTNGLYKISRNPMYLGFDLLTISAIVYTMNFWVLLLGLYSIVVYHLIIKGEEKFLEERFGDSYLQYKKNVRRYL